MSLMSALALAGVAGWISLVLVWASIRAERLSFQSHFETWLLMELEPEFRPATEPDVAKLERNVAMLLHPFAPARAA